MLNYHINMRSKYCSWNFVGGNEPSVQLRDIKEVKAWLRRSDVHNAAIYGVHRNTAMAVTRSLVSGGRRYMQVLNSAHRDLVG